MTKKDIDLQQYKILQEAVNNGIINLNQTAQKNNEMKRERVLKMHQYKIYFREKDQYWYTHLPDETKKEKRRKIKKKNLRDLEDTIVAFYTDPRTEESGMKTLRDVYPHWLEYIASRTSATTTVRRYDADWRRWLERDPIVDMPLESLDYITMDTWAHKLVKGDNTKGIWMTSKQYYNTATIVKGCLNFAFEKHAIDDNAYLRVRIDKKLFRVPEKDFDDDRDQVFNENELQQLRDLAWNDYIETRNEAALAVLLVSYTGLRAGEAGALKWHAIDDNMTELKVLAQVVKKERRDKDGNWTQTTWELTTRVKSLNSKRTVYIPEKLRGILMEHKRYKNPQSGDEMIFLNEDGSYLNNGILYRKTIKYANRINTYRKGTHKLRKTYLSVLFDGGVHESTLTKIAGQAIDGKVLHKHYLKDRRSQDEVRQKIDALI